MFEVPAFASSQKIEEEQDEEERQQPLRRSETGAERGKPEARCEFHDRRFDTPL
jgi:hypothetical protein